MEWTGEVVAVIGIATTLCGAALGYGIRRGVQDTTLRQHTNGLKDMKDEMTRCNDKLELHVERIEKQMHENMVAIGRLEASTSGGFEALDGRLSRLESYLNGEKS